MAYPFLTSSSSMSLPFAKLNKPLLASFYRGGTSRGLILRENVLAPFSQADRDRILCQAMGSPDPDGRQIDGLGGGTSSTSKVAIVSKSQSDIAMYAREKGIPLPGLDWIDDATKIRDICDIVYRAGQVSIRNQSIDWSSTCGNMIAAVALYAIAKLQPLKPDSVPSAHTVDPDDKTKYTWPIRILAHDTGKVFTAHVPVEVIEMPSHRAEGLKSHLRFRPASIGDTQIAGVPGKAPGIVIESPLVGSVLPTGNERDTIELDGKQIEVSIVDTGLPVVFVSAKSLDIPLASLLEHPASIDSNQTLMAKLEQVRQKACNLTSSLKLSPPSPKLCVVHPRCEYTTTGGQMLPEDSMDILIRTVSTGQLHRTVPATTLAALAASICFRGSVVSQNMSNSDPCQTSRAEIKLDTRAITVGQPAGCSTATVKVTDGLPTSILITRTARPIMNGSIQVDSNIQVNEAVYEKSYPSGRTTIKKDKKVS